MITFRLNIRAPWRREFFRNLGYVSGRITKNLAWELEHTYYSDSLLDADVDISRHCDHAGLEAGIGILGYGIACKIYDIRHWNTENNTWEEYNV